MMYRCKAGLALAALGACLGCGDDDNSNGIDSSKTYFNGAVYDGARGQQLKTYTIEMRYLDQVHKGSVNEAGEFLVGPLVTERDYTVDIRADGYRSFLAHNPMVAETGPTYFYDAYLFPNDLSVSPVDFHVSLSDSPDKPSGFLRLQATTMSKLYDEMGERPAAIGSQVWDNDQDLQGGTTTVELKDGAASVSGDNLVYGVNYKVTVFGIPGYRTIENASFQAGVDGEQGLVAVPLARSPLEVAFRSDSLGAEPTGKLVVVLNVPAEFDPPSRAAQMEEQVDASLQVATTSPESAPTKLYSLKPEKDSTVAERGTKLELDGTTLTLTWNRSQAFTEDVPDAQVRSVTYGALNTVRIRPQGADPSQGKTLSELLGGQTEVTIRVNE